MALANWPAFPGQQRSLRRMCQVFSWALARSPGGSQPGVGAVGVLLGGWLVPAPVRGKDGVTGAVHDLTAARIWGIVRELAAAGLIVLADKGYHGPGDPALTPYRGRDKPASQQEAHRAHAKRRSPGERAGAQLKTWRILRKLRCCPGKASQLAKVIHLLQARQTQG